MKKLKRRLESRTDLKRYLEVILVTIVFGTLLAIDRWISPLPIPKNMSVIAAALASIFGSLVGFSLAALGIVFAIVQKKEYDALFKFDHAEHFFRVFKNNQLVSFLGFFICGIAMVDDLAKTVFFVALILSVVVAWCASFFRLVSLFDNLVNAEIKLRKKK